MNQFVLQSILLLFLLAGFNQNGIAQIEGIEYEDKVYSNAIHSTQFHLTGFPLTQPIIDLGSNATLVLTFDDLEEEIRDIYYTIIHCDADWQPSDLNVLEYLDGFDEDQITKSDFSFNTLKEYTNYELKLPNDNVKWTKSGNYLLVLYEIGEEKTPILTRRFMVVEPIVRINPKMVRPANIQKAKTHQEIDFKVAFEGLNVKDPKRELKATVLQNGRWDIAKTGLTPYFIYNEEVVFDYQDVISFPAGKEFRFIDLRSFRYKNEGVATIEEYKDIYEITLYPDPIRAYTAYQFVRDVNGNFTIENVHEDNNQIESDYGLVLFSLEKNMPYPDGDVYLFGKMTDWQIQEKFKLAYSEKLQLYAVDVLLKQGFYNYNYVYVPHNNQQAIDLGEIEGNWFETENEYNIFIYYRAFGGRYDRLVGAVTFNSNIN
jgi:hypothetical protein